MQTCIFDVIYQWKAIYASIVLCVSYILISVTKLWDMIISLSKCKGWMCHAKVLESKSGCKPANTCDFWLPITIKWEHKSYISDDIYKQHLIVRYHTGQRKSGQYSIRISLNDIRYATFIPRSYYITVRPDRVHTVEIFDIAYCTSWKSRWWSWMRKSEEV